jgi:DHHA1 domain/Recombination endonuclease VII
VKVCSIEKCGKQHYAKTFCMHHYNCSDEIRAKAIARRQTEEGKKKAYAKNIRYRKSFKGNMTIRFIGKGLSEEEKRKAENAFLNFDGRCYCCGTDDAGKKGWILDHKGEKFRGILCVWCNCAAGFLKDNIRKCKSLIRYLYKNNKTGPDYAAELGVGALAHINHYVREAVKQAQTGILQGYKTAVLNVPYLNCSEIGHDLAKTHQVSLTWFERGDGFVQFSLRSIGDIDVSAIAKTFNGGGHHNAAGFQLSLKESRDLVDGVLGRNATRLPGGCVK